MKGLRMAGVLGIVLTVLVASGCQDDAFSPRHTAADFVEDGWASFESGDLAEAHTAFAKAVAEDPGVSDAHCGLGWCCLRLDSLEAAIAHFDEARSNGDASADPCVGLALACRDIEPARFHDAIEWAARALTIAPHYAFDHEPDLDWKDIRLILAQSHYALADYEAAKVQVDVLNPGNSLDPTSDTFVEDLLAQIQRLGEQT